MGNCVYWCMLCLSNEVFNNALPMDSCTIQCYSLLWCSEPLVYLIITFCQYPVLNRGTYVKGQGLYPLGHCDWRLDGAFRIFHFWVLTFRYHKGTPIIRDRFESCYHHHSQVTRNSHAQTSINIPPTMCDVNLNLKLKPKPGIWLYTCWWLCPEYLLSSHGWSKILVVYIIFRIFYIFER